MSGIEVYDTYEEHGDWHKELAKQIGGLALGFIVGAAAVAFLASFGWVVVVVGAAAASMASSKLGEFIAGSVWDTVKSFDILVDNPMVQKASSFLQSPPTFFRH